MNHAREIKRNQRCCHSRVGGNLYNWVVLVLFLVFINVFTITPVFADHCAPGDTHMKDADGKPACLYGSDITQGGNFGSSVSDIRPNIRAALNIFMGFLGVIVVIMLIYGSILWITAAGNEERVSKGKHTLMWAAIGAIVVSIAWTITSYILFIGKVIN